VKIRKPKFKWSGPLGKRIGDPPDVALHNVAGIMSPEAIHLYHRDRLGYLGIAYHEHIDLPDKHGNVVVTICRPEWAMGGHTHMHNECYGIVVNGNYDKIKDMPPAQYAALMSRLRAAKKRWPKIGVKGHREFSYNITACPGHHYPLARVRRELGRPAKVARRDYPRLKVLMRDWMRAWNEAHPKDQIDRPRGFGWRLPNFGNPAQTLLWRITGRMVQLGLLKEPENDPTPEIAALLGMKKYRD